MCAARALLALVALCGVHAGPGPPGAMGPPDAPGPPELRFTRALYNVSVPENSAPRTYARQAPGAEPLGVQLPAPGASVRFRIRHGDKDKFFKAEERTVGDFCFLAVRTRAGHADVLNRERRDSYRLDVRATATLPDGRVLEADTVLALSVDDENDLSPLFYPTEYRVDVPEDAPLHASVARVTAEDADLGLNGEIYYSLEQHTDLFAVHVTSGVVTLTRALSAALAPRHRLTVLAQDRAALRALGTAAPAARAALTVHVLRANLHAPRIRLLPPPDAEEGAPDVCAALEVTDDDEGERGRVAAVEVVGGDPHGHLVVRAAPPRYLLEAHPLLERDAPRHYNVTLRALDAGRPPRASYLTVALELRARSPAAPVFTRELYEASVRETVPPGTPVIRLKVDEEHDERAARVYIEVVGGNEGDEFYVNPDTGVLYTAVPLDAEQRALYTLTVSAVDQGDAATRKQSSAKVKITVLDANDNDPAFESGPSEVTLQENGASGAVVARLSARDRDSGDNAYVSYSVANLRPVPFDVDHFTGVVRTTRLLDYESMRRRYTLRIRASDWGTPYRRQAETSLVVLLQDVNDNRPQFERVDCVGYLPRRLPIGSEVVTLSAIDLDAGDVVSYRIIGGNEDNCFALDANSGVLSVTCDLGDVRADTRVLNVTATDGTHFADAAALSLHLVAAGAAPGALECRDTGVARRLTDLLAAAERANAPLDPADEPALAPSRYGQNLHAPEFLDFPVEVKVNESVALGTSLVKLKARDRDLGYNGLLVFGISGGDAHSLFRVEPDTGELQVIGYLDREREAEYYLNVTVYDLGAPQRSSSRLLPVTVLDVNDNAPRFATALASFRVTENARNGTVIFRANATDRDAGSFGRLAYSVRGAERGEFCVERASGVLRVCAPLDRERRALYELAVRAQDGGGLWAEALVRVSLDDVNDNAPRFAPRFALGTYVARVREDVPLGTLVAVVDATDPDLDDGGRLLYSLPYEEPDDACFTVDPTSGTLRTAKLLDFEEKPGYSVTVRATDGGQPALWAEVTVFVEVDDVDENQHSPQFAHAAVLEGAVREDAERGTMALLAAASDADAPGRDSRLAYYIVAGSGMAHFTVDDAGAIRTLTPLDRETVPHYWLTLCAQDHGLVPRHACVRVYLEVLDVNDEAPWPARAAYAAEVVEHCAPGTHVATVVAVDGDASPEPAQLTYSIVAGNPDGLFSIDEATGEVVTTGRALDREAAPAHALEVRASDGALSTTARLLVRLADLNDHAPSFAHRYSDVRVPADPHDAPPDDSSAEWEDEDEGTAPRQPWDLFDEPAPHALYVATVVALDGDRGDNGTVRYWGRARGAARGLLRVHARSGRVLLTRGAAPAPGRTLELAVRACDMAPRPRCSVARVTVHGAKRGGGRPPVLAAPPPLQVTELDAPGYLLTVLQASDPDGDPVYYDIADGDPQHQFYVGREDGSLVLARRLVWETQPHYALNVSATDGLHLVYVTVNITVINDSFEEGVSFERDLYVLDVAEDARVGDVLGTLRARAHPAARLLYGVHAARAPASHKLFRLHELSGVLELARALDRESAAEHELTVWARDQAPRSSRAYARVKVRVLDADEHAPEWGRALVEARVGAGSAPGALVAALRAWDRDAGEGARVEYSLAGGGAGGLFAVDAALGDVRLTRRLPGAPRSYTLSVRAANPAPGARAAFLTLVVHVVEPDAAPPRFPAASLSCELYENEPAGAALLALDAHSATSVWYSLEGGAGLFRINPTAGLLSTVAPLDYETQNLYNLTVAAVNMGGGRAETHVVVHVLDTNEFPPVLSRRTYRGRVSEGAPPGALVMDLDAGAPLVLDTQDRDSPAHRQRAFEIVPPAAAALFLIDATTGALVVRAPLDYERAQRHVFTVRVLDMGSPRLPGISVAEVTVEVLDVNDCPPRFPQALYEATLLLPAWAGVAVVRAAAEDPDGAGGALSYDILEGDPEGAFSVSAEGEVRVAAPALLRDSYRLRVRASDGQHASTTRVAVRVQPADNSGLAFQKAEYFGSLLENSTKPTTILVVNVLGAALNEHVQFTILNPTEGFQVGQTSGAVRSSGLALDRELRAHYELVLEARSAPPGAAPRVARALLHVALTDVNDNCPVFVHRPYEAAVRAGDPPGTPVITVEALDLDDGDNGEVRYEMKRGNGELFRVDRRSGLVSLKQTPEAGERTHSLVVGAFDGGVPACGAEAEVRVRVWGGGAAPSWPRAHFALDVREDAAVGAPLGAPLRAHSPLQRQLIYTLLNDTEALFDLHYDTAPDRGNSPCVLVSRGALDREAAGAHSLVVRATDGVTGAHADASLTVRVRDLNDCAPSFQRDTYRAALKEDAPLAHSLLTVAAADLDQGANGDVTYSLWWLEGAPEDDAPPFSVHPHSGDVTLSGALDRERRARYHLVVTASDAGAPPLSSTAHLFVEVLDVNDCAPRVERAVLAAPVSEEAARGTWLARVAAWDPDAADAGRLRYSLLGAAQRSFVLDEHTGVLALGEAPRPAGPRSLNVSVSDGAHASFARVKLSPTGANRAAPHFPHLVHETRALENQPPPLLLTTVKAYDEDAGEYGAVRYSIPSARLRDTFSVDATSGAFTARVALDREARAHWDVPVLAADGGGLLAHSVVRVRVLDADDCAPRFPLREYRATVQHDAAPHRALLAVTALDEDAPDHARLLYSLRDDPAQPSGDLLRVDPTSGAVSLARSPAAHAGRSVRVWVRARDGGGLQDEAALVLHVLRAGQAAPRLAPPPPALFLREDAAPGALLVQLRSSDPDAPQPRFRLAPALYPRDLFAVDEEGRLTLAGRLDREAAAEHVIGVVAEGAEGAASMVVTRLLVLDVNEHAPSFHSQPYVVHVAENTPPHSSLVQLMADDPDSGANGEVRYSLADDEAGALFAVDAHSGWVTTLAPLDREARAEHRLTLLAADGGLERRTARGTLVVRVLDYNDCAPRFSSDDLSAEVREDAPAGTVLLRLDVLDDDATAAPLSFFVADGDPRARFQLRASGELLVARALDRELEARYELLVAATDGKFTATARVHVTVLDVNDNPPYCLRPRYSVQLSEDVANGTLVATLETGDEDEPHNTHLRYYLTGDDAHHFLIDKQAGAVRVAARLDREARARYALAAHAQDRERADWRCSSELLVTLLDVNDNAPLFSAGTYSVTLPEDADVGTLVAKVHATDEDLGLNRLVRYSLVDGSGDDDTFHLSPDTGIVTLRAPLDRETQAEHRLVVRATDGGSPALSSTATLRLTVADVNDNPPEFELREYRASVSELDAPGTELLRVRATSRDTGLNAVVHYSLVGGDDRDHFAVGRDSGVLSVARALDYERRRDYLLTVQALDGGTPPLSDLATLNISVTDGNDNAPRFTQPTYAARVREDAAPGARVLQLVAEDADSGANGRVSYSITRGDRDARFSLDPDTGLLSVAAPLDRETVPQYVLEVHARDHGLPALDASARVTVDLVDANDNPPLFEHSNYSAVVAEDRPLGHTLLKFLVEDADAPPNAAPFTFDFQSGNEMGAFRLEQDGSLRSATRFNHRIRDRYVLQVRVFDNGTPPLYSDAWVYVKVIEESQYPPVVTPLEVVINSYLDEFPGGVVGRVIASDRDAYDTLTYSIAPADGALYPPGDLFEIEPSDGTLSAAPRLDVGEYRLNVTVDDGKFLGFATVKVTVLLVSDEMLAQAIVVRFREVTDRDFVLSHRKGFLRAVSEATDCDVADVIVISVQPSGEHTASEARARRQVAQDLDVAFCVRGSSAPMPADALRRRLHQHLERLEERARLVVEELVRAACGGCEHGACLERVELLGAARALGCDVFALVAPAHRLRARCACERGYEGERCELAAPECAACATPAPLVAHLRGDGYLQYRVERGAVDGARLPDDELTLSLRFRTRRERGTLLAVAGRVDYAILEVAEGYLQFRMELGAGPAAVRAAVPVSDGAWHSARLERRGASMRLTVDRRSAQAHSPPPAAVLDARADRLLLGATLARHAHALANEQVTYGFDGCISELRLGDAPLPLEEGGASGDGRVQLVRRVRVAVGEACPALAPPSPCASYPCLHGGTCREPAPPPEGEGYVCACHARFSGPQCELDTDPCASQPCLHGAPCSAHERGYLCACPAGLAGERCERGRWCAPGVCAHGGACEEGEAGPSCRCRGYWGPRCQYDVDECAGEPCLNGATCLNEPGSFRCLCPPDKTGMNCGNPLYSDAVLAGGTSDETARAVREAWRWACEARWPLAAAGAALLLLLLTAVLVPLALRRRRERSRRKAGVSSPLNSLGADKLAPRGSKLSNLEAVRRERPASCAEPPPLNNVDTLRSYGSAGDELEGIPPDYRRNLNIDVVDRKPWSEQMHLHTFVDNKIYNDLKGCKAPARRLPLEPAGVYHWDCSDWCGGAGALPGISEVAGSERPDSSSPASPGPSPGPPYADEAPPGPFLPSTDDYTSDVELRARTVREPDAASLITMLEERNSLLGCDEDGSGSELSANLCEIEESDAETEPARTPLAPRAGAARHTDV